MALCLKRLTIVAVLLILTAGATAGCLTGSKKVSTPTPTTAASASSSPTTTAQPDASTPSGTPGVSASPDTAGASGASFSGPSVTVSGIFDTPDSYDGETVTTHGEIDEVIGSNAFTVVDDNQVMLVLGSEQAIPANLTKGQFVQISGTVHTFDVATFEAELGIGLEDEQYSRFVDQPAMMLRSIRVGTLAINDLLANLDAYQGRTVNITGQIADVVSVQAFSLGTPDAGDKVLAVTPFAAIPRDLGATAWVRVVGTVATLNTANITDLGAQFSFLDKAEYGQFNGQTVILGTEVEIIAPSETTTVGNILAQPEGAQTDGVTVSSQVGRRVTDQAFTIGADGRELLVLVATGTQPTDATPGALVVVSGLAQTFSLSNPPQISGQPIGIDLNDANLAPFLGQPILVATGIQVVMPGT